MKAARRPSLLCLCLLPLAASLAGCAPGLTPGPVTADFSQEIIEASDRNAKDSPPGAEEGQCWLKDDLPALIETVTEQRLTASEKRDADGTLVKPAVFTSESRQQILREGGSYWFRIPCPETLSESFITSLQRALKARGLYRAPLTGRMDAATRAAVRRYQAPRGLDSDQLSLAAAQDLGLVISDL